jgi:hypothetical protein
MLGKLIKHDFKSLSRILLPAQLAILGATILGTLGFALNYKAGLESFWDNSAALGLIRVLTIVLCSLLVLAIIAAAVLIFFIIFQRFYKNLISDEGYLTFTLPVTTAEILWSKLITAVLWMLISTAVVILSLNIFILFGTSSRTLLNLEFYRQAGQFFGEIVRVLGGRLLWPVLELLLFTLVATVFQILHIYLSLIIGGVVSHKHKLLAGIGFYFAINIGVSILSTVLQFFLTNDMVRSFSDLEGRIVEPENALEVYNHVFGALQPYYWCYLVFFLALSAGGFLLSHYLLKNKLNLE